MTNPGINVTNNAAAKPADMSDKQIRLECVKQAVLLEVGSSQVVDVAQALADFVINGG